MPSDRARPPAAVVLAGGRGRRLGGVDKAGLVAGGRTLLDRALAAVAGCAPVLVVGPPGPERVGVLRVREDPAYGGPAAGLLAGLDAVVAVPAPADRLTVLAVDLPGVTAATIDRLASAADGDGAVLVDRDGRRQPALVLAVPALLAVAPPAGARDGLALHRLLAPLDLVEVAATDAEAQDVDTPEDLRRLS